MKLPSVLVVCAVFASAAGQGVPLDAIGNLVSMVTNLANAATTGDEISTMIPQLRETFTRAVQEVIRTGGTVSQPIAPANSHSFSSLIGDLLMPVVDLVQNAGGERVQNNPDDDDEDDDRRRRK